MTWTERAYAVVSRARDAAWRALASVDGRTREGRTLKARALRLGALRARLKARARWRGIEL